MRNFTELKLNATIVKEYNYGQAMNAKLFDAFTTVAMFWHMELSRVNNVLFADDIIIELTDTDIDIYIDETSNRLEVLVDEINETIRSIIVEQRF